MKISKLVFCKEYDIMELPFISEGNLVYTFIDKLHQSEFIRPNISHLVNREYANEYNTQYETEVEHTSQMKTNDTNDWLYIKFTNKKTGVFWIGRFETGIGTVSGVYCTYVDSKICVIAEGMGYWLSIYNPVVYTLIPCEPIVDVLISLEFKKAVFTDFQCICVLGENDYFWKSPIISWDGIKIKNITSESVKGYTWDAPSEQEIEFIFNFRDKSLTGGSNVQ